MMKLPFGGFLGFCAGTLATITVIYIYSSIDGILSWSTAVGLSLLILLTLFVVAVPLVVWLSNPVSEAFSIPDKETFFVKNDVLQLPRFWIDLNAIKSIEPSELEDMPYNLLYVAYVNGWYSLNARLISEREEHIISTALKIAETEKTATFTFEA